MITKIYTNINEVNLDKWQNLLSTSQFSSYFQSPEYFNLLSTINSINPYVVVVEEKDEYKLIVLGYIETFNKYIRKFTSRSIIESGILVSEDSNSPSYISSALTLLKKTYAKELLFFEIRNYLNYEKYIETFGKSNWKFKDHYNILVDCSKNSKFPQNISSSKIRQVKKSLKNGANINDTPTIEQVKLFYNILVDFYKNKIKKPLPDFNFFKQFYYSNTGKYFLIMLDEKIIGGIMCPIFKNETIYEWYIAGLDNEFKNNYPSILATYAPIKYAFENNINCFDFMGAGAPNKEYGVREFKMKFGGELLNLGRFYYIPSNLRYQLVFFLLRIKSLIK